MIEELQRFSSVTLRIRYEYFCLPTWMDTTSYQLLLFEHNLTLGQQILSQHMELIKTTADSIKLLD